MIPDQEDRDEAGPAGNHRRILKVRLPQEQVIRLHELRIVQGTSIAELLESILDDYFRKRDAQINSGAAPAAQVSSTVD